MNSIGKSVDITITKADHFTEYKPLTIQVEKDVMRKHFAEKEIIVKKLLAENGIDINDEEYIKEHISVVIGKDDEYEHIFFDYNKPTEKRIVSIQKPQASMSDVDNKYTLTISSNYY